jgi:H+/Cl- antiporter ClcA
MTLIAVGVGAGVTERSLYYSPTLWRRQVPLLLAGSALVGSGVGVLFNRPITGAILGFAIHLGLIFLLLYVVAHSPHIIG